MRTVAIVQARMGSTRLPGKVLLDLAGEPMLSRVLARLARARTLDKVVVATTVEPADDPLVTWCERAGWTVYRGSEADVLDRYHQVANREWADIVVRVTSDCPMIDPSLVDRVVIARADQDAAYASNLLPRRTYPRGLDTEVICAEALSEAWREATSSSDREHVTPFLWSQPDRFPQAVVMSDQDHSSLRWTVDTDADYELANRVYGHFGNDEFGWHDVLDVIQNHPDWSALNSHIAQKAL